MQVRLAPLSLLAGLAAGIATVAVYQWWWGLLIGAAATLLVVYAAPPGWGTRLVFAVGNAVGVLALTIPRPEGDYLVSASLGGYVVLGTGLVALGFAVATLPRPGRYAGRE